MSMTPAETREQAEHLQRLKDDPDYRAAHLHQAATERMELGQDCYPWYPQNISEALSNLDETWLLRFSEKLSVPAQDLTIVRSCIRDYWYRMACYLCEKEMGLL